MLITRVSMLSGKEHTLDIPVTQAQLDAYARGDGLIQDIMPNLSANDREFIKTGSIFEEWDDLFGEDDE